MAIYLVIKLYHSDLYLAMGPEGHAWVYAIVDCLFAMGPEGHGCFTLQGL